MDETKGAPAVSGGMDLEKADPKGTTITADATNDWHSKLPITGDQTGKWCVTQHLTHVDVQRTRPMATMFTVKKRKAVYRVTRCGEEAGRKLYIYYLTVRSRAAG